MATAIGNVTSAATKSWRTTLLGVFAGIAVILPELQAIFDNNPETAFNVETIIAGLALMGIGTVARDNVVPSEAANAVRLFLVGTLVVFAAGCKTYTAADHAFVNAADAYHSAVGEPFVAYVATDETLDENQKASRVRAHTLFGEAIAERRATMNRTTN